MALDRSFSLHAICMRVGAGHKERGHKMGYLLEFTAFRRGQFNPEKFVFYPPP
jgi:hypothetical protein